MEDEVLDKDGMAESLEEVTDETETPSSPTEEIGKDLETEDELAESQTGEDEGYTPNFTYEVRGEKREFDDRLKSIIKTKEDEDYIRDIITKADGLDIVKSKYENLAKEYDEVLKGSEVLISGYQKLKDAIESNDVKGIIESLGVSGNEAFKNAILDYALEIAELDAMPEEQRQELLGQQEKDRRLKEMESKLTAYEQQMKQREIQEDYNKLVNSVKTEHSDLMQTLENVGIDLVQEVIANGTLYYKTTGVEPSIEEAIKMTVDKYKNLTNLTQSNGQATVNQTVDNTEKPVLPRVRGQRKHGVAQKVTSLEDLKKLAAQF